MTIKRRIGLRVPIILYEKIIRQAQYHGKTINSTCLDIFWEYFENEDVNDNNNNLIRKNGEK